MLKGYAIVIILCSVYLANSLANRTEVYYDSKYDIIFHNGKLYFPNKIPQTTPNAPNDEGNNHNNPKPAHEEELVDGATFWFYLFFILCIKNISNLLFF